MVRSDQITRWSGILHARQEAIEPLARQAQGLQQAIARALGSANPDPLAVGQAIVTLHELQTQIAAANAQSASDFEKLPAPDQPQRLNEIRWDPHACVIGRRSARRV